MSYLAKASIKPVSQLGRSANSLAESRSAVLGLYRFVRRERRLLARTDATSARNPRAILVFVQPFGVAIYPIDPLLLQSDGLFDRHWCACRSRARY